jgi:hypothetical protein
MENDRFTEDDLEHRGEAPPTEAEAKRILQLAVNEHRPVNEVPSDEDRSQMLNRLGLTAYQLSDIVGVPVSSIENFVSLRWSGSDSILGAVLRKVASIAAEVAKR